MSRVQDAAERLGRGSVHLLTGRAVRIVRWVQAGNTTAGRIGRLLLLALPALLAWRLVRLVPVLLWPAAAAWCWASWRAAPAPPAAAPEPPAGTDPAEAVRALLRDLIGDAAGVHLHTVLAHLQKQGHHPSWKVADLRRHIEALGIPVEPKLKLAGTPTRGVRREAVAATPQPAAQGASPAPSPTV